MSDPAGAALARYRQRVDARLTALVDPVDNDPPPALGALADACRYVLGNGGKRIRPALLYLAAEAIDAGVDADRLDHPACAIEMIHSYSLVHDDLPAMDDDNLRRGQPSCHVAFGEAQAILVGDGLQARAFELLAIAPGLSADQRLAMVATLARASGLSGMVGGQAVDIAAIDSTLDIHQLRTMHNLKTGALIRAALAMGGIAAGAGDKQLQALDTFGQRIGLAFQVVDDILDVAGDSSTLGKTGGKDEAANKPTYTALLGLDGARAEAQALLAGALGVLEALGESADGLRDLARYVVARDR